MIEGMQHLSIVFVGRGESSMNVQETLNSFLENSCEEVA